MNLGGYLKAKRVVLTLYYMTDENKTSLIGKKMIKEVPYQSEITLEFRWEPYVVRNYFLKAIVETQSCVKH